MSQDYSIRALTHRFILMIGRGRILSTNAEGPLLKYQLSVSPKERPTIRRMTDFGFTSRPMKGADAVVVFVSGDRSNGMIIATNDLNHMFPLDADGESALFDAFGKSISLKKDGGIVIEAAGADVTVNGAANVVVHASTRITLDTPEVHCTGNLKVDGTIADSVRSIEQDRTIYDSHTHSGVTAGGANSGPPNNPE